jgi:cell division protein FtsL
MLRLNLILLLIVVACAISVVTSSHRARKLFTELEREQAHMRDLDVEWGQLQLEQSTWASHARIESVAREKLRMKSPPPAQVLTMEMVAMATPQKMGGRK